MLASTIQFTTNPPTPTHNPQQPGAPDRSGNQGALPQNPDSMPPPHAHKHAGAPTTTQQAAAGVSLMPAPDKPTTPHTSARQSAARPSARADPPAGPDPFNDPDNTRPGSHPA